MKDLVVKDNALVQAQFNLSLSEQRLVLLAIVEARNNGTMIDANSLISIHASNYAKQFGTDSKTAYKILKAASEVLEDKKIKFLEKSPKTGKLTPMNVPFLTKAGYEDHSGYIHLRFSLEVIPLITRMGIKFTSYEIQNIVKLTSGYAIRLYELIIQWRDNKGVTQKYTIAELREKLGVEPEKYTELYNLKIRVIDLAMKQINKHTDLTVSYKQHKEGRTIVALTFNFKFKTPKKLKDVQADKPFLKLSEKQLQSFSKQLAVLPELGSDAPIGATTEDYARSIAIDLQDKEKQKKYIKYLDKVGFKVA